MNNNSKIVYYYQTFIGLVPGKGIDALYLYYLMIASERKLNDLSSGSTITYLSRKKF